ncbi:MAG: transposase [Cyanobacteria bacterium P01_H01_bin.35]
MIANHNLAKTVADIGFYEFRRQLESKCELYSQKLIIIDRWFPSSKTYSRCSQVKKSLFLSKRVFNCEHYNSSCDRDLFAFA